jgi:Na+/melibiose symporter-like transporter
MREMILFLRNLKGNAKGAILAQPLWGIPFNLFTPFATLYMFHLGVTDIQIGMMLAIGRFSQMALSFFGGVVTDKYGRRLTTLVGDILSWGVPALIWALAQDFRWFVAAAIVNSFVQITGVAWECLWVDEIGDDGAKLTQVYNWLQICGVLAVFFVPIAGFFVNQFELVPVVRVIYIFACICMTSKSVLLYVFSRETERGKERMAETKNTPLWKMLAGYKDVFAQVFRNGKMLRVLGLSALQNVTLIITTTFFSLYATQSLGLSESFLAYFPILRAAVMMVFLFLIQNLLNKLKTHNVMLCGIIAYVLANGILLVAPPNNLMWLAMYTFVEACAVALLMPRLGSLTANAIEPKERARIRSLFNAGILAVVSPFAYLAGVLSDMNRSFPFMLNIVLFVFMFVFVLADARKSYASS